MTTLLLARHGETPWNAESRVQGWAATGLTDRGTAQARALGTWLDRTADIDRVVASDLERTRVTAATIREAADSVPEPTYDGTLRERGFGVYQGFPVAAMVDRFPDHDHDKSILTLPVDPLNGESFETFTARIERGWDRVTEAAGDGETTLVVTHGGVLKYLRGLLTDGEPAASLARDSPPNCSVTTVRLDGATPELVEYGATPWDE
jgi:probable phosphoglycerate mutase